MKHTIHIGTVDLKEIVGKYIAAHTGQDVSTHELRFFVKPFGAKDYILGIVEVEWESSK